MADAAIVATTPRGENAPFLVILAALVAACGATPEPPSIGDDADPDIVASLPISDRTFEMGTAGFVPRHYPASSDADWQDLFDRGAAAYGGIYGVHVNPAADPDTDGVPAQVALAFEQIDGVEPYVAFGHSHEEGPFTDEKGEALVRAAVATAARYQPRYLSLGVESNSMYVFEEESYALYVSYAREAYDQIKAVSPETLVMNNFLLDRMKGQTALTGDQVEAHWELIDLFEGKIDVVSFTVYPFLHHRRVEDIPGDYLAEVREHTDLPVVITETGWPTADLVTGVSGSDAAQADYAVELATHANGIAVEAIVWVFPHDAAFGLAGGIFDAISLFSNDGQAKPAYEHWKAINALPHQR